MASTDEELVARSRTGDLDSFNQLVLRWERPIYALAYRTIGREEDARTAILLKEYHGLTFQEIANMQDCPLSTVKTRLYQGLTVLRRQLERSGVSGGFRNHV